MPTAKTKTAAYGPIFPGFRLCEIRIHCGRNKAVEKSHRTRRKPRKEPALRADTCGAAGNLAIRYRIQHDRQHDQQHTREQQRGVSDRMQQRNSTLHRAPERCPFPPETPRDIPAISIAATSKIFARLKIAPPNNAEWRLECDACVKISQERPARGSVAAQRQPQNYRQQQYADRVVPVEQLESPAFFRQLSACWPTIPSKTS